MKTQSETKQPESKKLTIKDLEKVTGGMRPVLEKHEIPSTGDLPCKFEM